MTLYYKAQQAAMTNGHDFHVVACLLRGKTCIRLGTNSCKTHTRNKRQYKNTRTFSYHHHAETDALLAARPGDTLIVLRFLRNGKLTCAKPCSFCAEQLQRAGIKNCYYTDWDGQFKRHRK